MRHTNLASVPFRSGRLAIRTLLVAVAITAILATLPGHAANCAIAQPHPLTPEQLAALTGNLTQAESLYRQKLGAQPRDPELTAALVDVLLEEQKIDEAESTATTALAAVSASSPQSVPLLTALARVQHRQGLPWDQQKTLIAANKIDPCYPLLHLAFANFYSFNSYHASSLKEIKVAHQLDPYDPDIQRQWIQTLPIQQRIDELKKFLASNTGDVNSLRGARHELAVLVDRLENSAENRGGCHLASPVASTEIPFTPIMVDATRVRGWGLEVRFNDHKSRLQVDTGAGGLYITRSVAEHAGLKSIAQSQGNGIGDKGPQSGYTAFADSIKIGGLEFKNCLVEVSDRNNVVDVDGLIGMDVFSNFLVTLDFPWRKLTLGPLPPYPDSTTAAPATLNTQQESAAESTETPSAPTPDAKTTEQAKAAPQPRGPHDRYIAPEMKNWEMVYRVGHMMIVPASLNSKTRRLFIIDTGAFRTSISPSAAREVTKVHEDANSRVHGISGSVANVYRGDKITVQFAHLQQEMDDILSFDNTGISRNLGTEISGFLGFDLLHLLVVKIDYRDGLMDFEYSADRGYQHIR